MTDGGATVSGSRQPAAPGLVSALRAGRATVGTAESLTGGLVCAALVDVPGASDVVRGAVVAYAVDVKHDLLGVPQELLDRHGTVSRECALAMAEGARRLLRADWGVSTTGVAGPGPSEGHPAGTVHVAVSGEQTTRHVALTLHGSRSEVREATVERALALLGEAVRRTSALNGTVDVSHGDG